MMSNLCTLIGTLSQFFSPYRVGAWSKLFLAIGPEKEYPNLGLKFWGLPPPQKKIAGGGFKVSPNFLIFRLFHQFLHNRARYHQSENGLSNYGHSLWDGEKWCTLVHHEIHDCGSFTPTLWAEVFQLDEAASS